MDVKGRRCRELDCRDYLLDDSIIDVHQSIVARPHENPIAGKNAGKDLGRHFETQRRLDVRQINVIETARHALVDDHVALRRGCRPIRSRHVDEDRRTTVSSPLCRDHVAVFHRDQRTNLLTPALVVEQLVITLGAMSFRKDQGDTKPLAWCGRFCSRFSRHAERRPRQKRHGES